MPSQYLTFTRKFKSEVVTRVRPLVFLRKLLTNILGNAGPRFAPAYLDSSRIFAESELRWINRRGIGETDFYSLMSLYPTLQRVFFIHIPKCGGTSVRKTLVDEGNCVPVPVPASDAIKQSIEYMTSSAPPKSLKWLFLDACAKERDSDNLRQRFLRIFAGYRIVHSPKRVFILGHKRAKELMPYFRDGTDLLFTTVREPAEILMSVAAYRVSHTLKNEYRQDSIRLLESLQLNLQEFTELVRTQPRHLTELILEKNPPSLVGYLSMDNRIDHESVWRSLRDKTVFISHMSEQAQMLCQLFGGQPSLHRKNTSENRPGLAADFTAAVHRSWTEPFVDPNSAILYERMEAAGIIGFWQSGGTLRQYRDLLKNA